MVLLLILAGALVLFATQIVSIEAVALGVVALLALSGILTPGAAFAGFSSAATLTVAAMLVISAGLERSGVVDHVAARLVRIGGGGERRMLLALLVPTALFSAFMNNTPVVALMMPVAITGGGAWEGKGGKGKTSQRFHSGSEIEFKRSPGVQEPFFDLLALVSPL
jgi:Na+/H+ antiporter NhaD/arsenite permease-like protein